MASSSRRRRAPGRSRFASLFLLVAAIVAIAVPPLPEAAAATCPCTIWPSTATPGTAAVSDAASVELGVKFRADTSGYVKGIRFYKGTGNTGTHLGRLWSRTGSQLATATFTNETATGWQQVNFATPVAVTANTTYVASYYAPNGHYAVNNNFFATAGVDNPPLHALADGVDGGNGVYRYSASGGFPNSTYQSTNYWVDVVFDTTVSDTTPPTVTGRTPAPGATGVSTSANVTATFSEPVQSATITFTLSGPGGAVPAAVTYDAGSQTATLNPNADLATSTSYTATVSGARDTAGNQMTAPVSWSFTTAAAGDTTPPTVTGRTPAPGATGVSTSANVTATFSEPVQSATITFTLSGPGGAVPAAVTYDGPSQTATLNPNADLAASTSYTATVNGARDTAGNQMTAPVSWSFTTAAAAGSCPCTIWPASTTPGTPADGDNSAVELGVRFRADVDGFITGIRFYKGAGNSGTHIGNLWTNLGTQLATATFTGETASGWQQVNFPAPVAVTANTTYVASYFAPSGHYAADNEFFATSGVVNPPLRALADGADGANGVYRYGSTGFPTSTFESTNYWVDVVFNQTSNDTTPPTVVGRSPAPGATGVAVSSNVMATFNEPVQSGTISFTLTGPGGAVPSAVTYDGPSQTATLNPDSDLAASTSYTATVSGARDTAGNQMTAPVSWSFTTAAPAPPPPDEGPGGPILVVGAASNPFGRYPSEILRAEGLNEFTTTDISTVNATMLNNYDVVILGEMSLNASQVTMLTNWVNAGGNLIAMRPNAQLAGLLGLSGGTTTLSDAYLKVDTTTGPGVGITDQTIQFHGTADRYTLSGAIPVATLYSNAGTATSNPAVTLRSVGGSGGQAAAFTYDLARSVVYTRQGNPAWAGQERDGASPIRSDDLFFPDWVDLDKVAIPQADEQQRLLVNLIEQMNRDRKPLPRFWYFPGTAKAVVVATGDDHAGGGTAGRFDQYKANSPSGCVVASWECLRFTSYIYTATPLSNAQAASYNADGFEVALHVNTGCSNWTPSSLETLYANQLSAFTQKYTSIPAPASHRVHCLVWSDWSTQADVEKAHGIRLDVNYYYWPPQWIDDRPGFFTGSGMPMRYAKLDGTMIDVYQATTQMTDESGQSYPFTPNTLLDRALGPLGYYGVFTANVHTDSASSFQSDSIMASAQARGVAMVSAKQMLTWLDGRNNSSFGSITRNGDNLNFTVSVASGANGLSAMVPTLGATGSLSGLTRNGSPVSYTTQTIKGLQYAVFTAAAGNYTATYTGGGAASVSQADEQALGDGTSLVSWKTSEGADSRVLFGSQPDALTQQVADPQPTSSHELVLRGLRPRTTYYYRVVSKDSDGRVTVSPAADAPPASFRTPAADTTPPAVSAVRADPLPDGTAVVSWRTSEPSDSRVQFGTSSGSLTDARVDAAAVTSHSVVLTNLKPRAVYWYRVVSQDAAGNQTATGAPKRLVASAPGVVDTTTARFRQGSRYALAVGNTADGELALTQHRSAGTFTSRVLDARAMVTWDRAAWRAQLPAGTSLRVSVRAGSTSRPDGTWTRFVPLARSGVSLAKLGSSRYVQYRVELATSNPARTPVLSSIGFTYKGAVASLPVAGPA